MKFKEWLNESIKTINSDDGKTELISASSDRLVLGGDIRGSRWKGEYRRIPNTLGFVLIKDYRDSLGYETSALPHGDACVLPELLGRAILVRDERMMNDLEIIAHENGHVLAYRYGLGKLNYGDNEEMADKLALRLLRKRAEELDPYTTRLATYSKPRPKPKIEMPDFWADEEYQ